MQKLVGGKQTPDGMLKTVQADYAERARELIADVPAARRARSRLVQTPPTRIGSAAPRPSARRPRRSVAGLAVRRSRPGRLRAVRAAAAAADVQYSLYRWDGVGPSTWVGLRNYGTVFTDPDLLDAILNAFKLIVFFSFIPVVLGLLVASVDPPRSPPAGSPSVARTVLFLPQVIPLVAAGIVWSWLLSSTGFVNQVCRASASAASPGPGSATSTWRCPRSASSAPGCCSGCAPCCCWPA